MSDTPTVFDMPPVSAGFDARGAWLLTRLMSELGLLPVQAAGIVGTLGAESGIEAIQERAVASPKGGFGFAQWTADRRKNFFRWCADHDMNVTDDAANCGFLLEELRGDEAHALDRIRQTTTLEAATETAVKQFERPSDPDAETKRAIPLARRALAAAIRLQTPSLPSLEVHHSVMPEIQIMRPLPPHTPFIVPPVANGAVVGGASLVAMMIVKQVAFGLGLLHVMVPDDLQSLTTGGIALLIGWFLHTRLSKAMLLDQQK